jgi:hypothetical protein
MTAAVANGRSHSDSHWLNVHNKEKYQVCSLLSKALTRPDINLHAMAWLVGASFIHKNEEKRHSFVAALSDAAQCCGLTNKQMNKRGL